MPDGKKRFTAVYSVETRNKSLLGTAENITVSIQFPGAVHSRTNPTPLAREERIAKNLEGTAVELYPLGPGQTSVIQVEAETFDYRPPNRATVNVTEGVNKGGCHL
jgi:hypothetical protein